MAPNSTTTFFFITFLLFTLLPIGTCTVGVCYGRNADNLPSPDKVAQLLQLHAVTQLRIYDSNIQILKAFSNSGIDLIVGVPNSDLLPFAQFQSNADTWLKNTILPYYPAAKITHITVGAEVTESPTNLSTLLLPAMRNVFTALRKAGLDRKIKVSSTHSLGVLSHSFPPSAGTFDGRYLAAFLRPMLEFLVENDSPFMVNVYPYYAYRDSSANVSLDYALFESSSGVIDPNTGLLYTNMFDAQLDAVNFALTALDFQTVKVMVTETGWPSKGSPKETAATSENARTFNTNLIRHVINSSGTPAKPGADMDVYIFSLFNENRKPGMESERNWGLFLPNQTSVYDLDFTGRAAPVVDVPPTFDANNGSNSNATWCIAMPSASEDELQRGLDWACGPGNVDCSAIQESQACFEPDDLASHAAYAFNAYYQENGATDAACSFGGAGTVTDKNPSYNSCIYAAFGNRSAASNITTVVTPAQPESTSVGWRVVVSGVGLWVVMVSIAALL